MFVYQTIFNMLELKNDKCTEYIISRESKGIYNSKLIALQDAFLPNVKCCINKREYKLIALLQLWNKTITQ